MNIFMKEKERVHKWLDSVINNFIYFYHKCLQVSLMNGKFFIFTDQVLKISFWSLFNALEALSCNLFSEL